MFALRLLRRDARAGELYLLTASLVIAVASLTAVGFFTDRVRQALEREANQLLGADLVLVANHPLPTSVVASAKDAGLSVAETRVFPSMAVFGEGDATRAQLVEIKSVSDNYPLRGRVRIAPDTHSPDAPAPGIPPPGEVWIDTTLASLVSARVGDTLSLGRGKFRVAAILTLEPDRGMSFYSVVSRLIMNQADLENTALIQAGSRVVYRLLVAGDADDVERFRDTSSRRLERGERIEDARNARPEIRRALDRAQKFLGLSALLTVILAAVSVALASRRYMQRHLDACAVMRCLGAKQGFLFRVYFLQFAVLGILASLAGCVIGYATHFILYAGLSRFLGVSLLPPGFLPVVQGVAVGLSLLAGFALPPVFQLKRVPTMRVLRREFSDNALPPWRLVAAYASGFSILAALMFWVAGESRLGRTVVFGFSGALIVFALVAFACVRLAGAHRWRKFGGHFGWRYGLASLSRRTASSVVQIVALGLGFMALILLTVTRNDLLDAWRETLPPDAPNRFVINIQPDQLEDLGRFFAESSVSAEFSPMVRARLVRINGAEPRSDRYSEERFRRMIEREFNLSYREALPEGNLVTEGRWFSGNDALEASLEAGLAKSLHLGVGDRLEFSVAGESVEIRVVGIRTLKWDSMRVNFFVLTPPGALRDFPASWITSFHLAPENAEFVNRLVRAHPNLTVIDTAVIVRQLQSVIDQVAQAVQFVFLFTLAAGVIVLYATLISAADERRFELAVMRALGARREQLRRAMLAEFAVVGGLAGLIASGGATVVGQLLSKNVFQFELFINYPMFPVATLFGAFAVMLAGWFAASRLIDAPPLAALRAGQ